MRSALAQSAERRTLKAARKAGPCRLEIHDPVQVQDIIRERQRLGIDKYDEVWEGVYVMPPLANNPHQRTVMSFAEVYRAVTDPERDEVLPGANVSDRRSDWEKNFRCPDVLVVLHGSRAVDCGTHWFGGPDLLTEIKSPGDDTDEKIPFYSKLQVRELLIVHRDTRELRLLRHNGQELVEIEPVIFKGELRLVSEVLPLAFRCISAGGRARTEILRTNRRGKWIV